MNPVKYIKQFKLVRKKSLVNTDIAGRAVRGNIEYSNALHARIRSLEDCTLAISEGRVADALRVDREGQEKLMEELALGDCRDAQRANRNNELYLKRLGRYKLIILGLELIILLLLWVLL